MKRTIVIFICAVVDLGPLLTVGAGPSEAWAHLCSGIGAGSALGNTEGGVL